eukprot:2836114-Amphidinium_carterae.1
MGDLVSFLAPEKHSAGEKVPSPSLPILTWILEPAGNCREGSNRLLVFGGGRRGATRGVEQDALTISL